MVASSISNYHRPELLHFCTSIARVVEASTTAAEARSPHRSIFTGLDVSTHDVGAVPANQYK